MQNKILVEFLIRPNLQTHNQLVLGGGEDGEDFADEFNVCDVVEFVAQSEVRWPSLYRSTI